MFETALKARLPFIGVATDDLASNVQLVLQHYTGKKAVPRLPNLKAAKDTLGYEVYWTDDAAVVDDALYGKLLDHGKCVVVINPGSPNPLIFDAGTLPTPNVLMESLLKEEVEHDKVPDLLPSLRGLSLRVAGQVINLTQARAGELTALEIRRTRASLSGLVQGLQSLDTTLDFYEPNPTLWKWLTTNKPYFLGKVHPKLVPKGVLLNGLPGTGKTDASKAIASFLGVPLYHLDVAATLNKYIGVSEERIAKILALVDREEPCVLLLDEVEKIFTQKGDSEGTTGRILSQLLFWLATHQSRVFVVMTTNNKDILPPELYREGRLDWTFTVPPLNFVEAKVFAQKAFQSIMGVPPSLPQGVLLTNALEAAGALQTAPGKAVAEALGALTPKPLVFAHGKVIQLVTQVIKANGWAL